MRVSFGLSIVASSILACGSNGDGGGGRASSGDAGADSSPVSDAGVACAGACPQSKVKYLVVVVQENHTFDSHFGRYCTAATGSHPTCNDGPSCCEAAPDKDPSGAPAITLDDAANGTYDPNHTQQCELAKANGGMMDHYATGAACANPKNVAYADAAIVRPYWDLAKSGALADRYFQPVSGQSASNDMYLARAQFVFRDNVATPKSSVGADCVTLKNPTELNDTTIGDLLDAKSIPWAFYAEGYQRMKDANAQGAACSDAPSDCPGAVSNYPCTYDPSDDPFQYYASTRDKPEHAKDFAAFAQDLAAGTLPAVSFVKGVGYHSEHPGDSTRLSDGVAFATGVVHAVQSSAYKYDVLVVVTYDEGGGYFDHVAPPPTSAVDNQPYGTRVPFIATGPFARANYVSHVTMEHSSLVKFIEWNWLGATGQLKGRDATVANIGSVLDPAKTGVAVPDN